VTVDDTAQSHEANTVVDLSIVMRFCGVKLSKKDLFAAVELLLRMSISSQSFLTSRLKLGELDSRTASSWCSATARSVIAFIA
jgi:hypothetical protein